MTKQDIINNLMTHICNTYVMPTIQRGSNIAKPIKYNAALDENDYAEYLAKKANKLTHINNRKDDNNGR